MKNTTKFLAVIITGASLLTTGVAFADSGDCGWKKQKHNKMHYGKKDGMVQIDNDRKLNIEQIKTIMDARLIKRGNDNVQVGDIKLDDNTYKVNIVTKDNSLVKTISLNQAGFPIKR